LRTNAGCGPSIVPVSHVGLEVPRAAVQQFLSSTANFSSFFNPHREPRNLHQLTQLLALDRRQKSSGVQARSLQLEGIVLPFVLEAQT